MAANASLHLIGAFVTELWGTIVESMDDCYFIAGASLASGIGEVIAEQSGKAWSDTTVAIDKAAERVADKKRYKLRLFMEMPHLIVKRSRGGAHNVKHVWTDKDRDRLATKYAELRPIWIEAKKIAKMAQQSAEATRKKGWRQEVLGVYPDLPTDLLERFTTLRGDDTKPSNIAMLHAARLCLPPNVELSIGRLRDELRVARHIRPFVVITWACRHANQLAQIQGKRTIAVDQFRDFVDRIDVIYVWSQFLRHPSADLPGRRVLANLLKADEWTFGGAAWGRRRQSRRYSTALTAPITYGPALKNLGWVQSHPKYPDILIPTLAAEPALDAFEAKIRDHLHHPAFSQFGSVTVTAAEARQWSHAWALESPTTAERNVMKEMLFGLSAPLCRQRGGDLMIAAGQHFSTRDVGVIRAAMAGPPSRFMPSRNLVETQTAWRTVQVRQLFRLSLEALLHWTVSIVSDGPKTTDALTNSFLFEIPEARNHSIARRWLTEVRPQNGGPTELMGEIKAALNESFDDLPKTIIRGLAFCLAEGSDGENELERPDRLPLSRARREADALADRTPSDFVRHVLEAWVLAQHVYWSVGRGLADARAQGKTLLRLKVVLDEGGWGPAPGVSTASPPEPTPDRLRTMVSLASECGLV
jgi:hypothetical protein